MWISIQGIISFPKNTTYFYLQFLEEKFHKQTPQILYFDRIFAFLLILKHKRISTRRFTQPLRTIRVTITVYRGSHSKFIIFCISIFQHQAGVRFYTLYSHFAEACVFNNQSTFFFKLHSVVLGDVEYENMTKNLK